MNRSRRAANAAKSAQGWARQPAEALWKGKAGFLRGKVPKDLAEKDTGSPVLIVVASVDVQKRNLFIDVKGYSMGGAIWTLNFFPIDGDKTHKLFDRQTLQRIGLPLAYHINTTKLKNRVLRSLN